MKPDEIRKLVGGYATGTLTEAERALLFEAALDDQNLFDELASEHALKELLEEPGVRQRLADSLAPALTPAFTSARGPVFAAAILPQRLPWWMRPWPVSALGAVALGLLIVVALLRPPETREIAAVTSAPVSAEVQSNADEALPAASPKTAPAAAFPPSPVPANAPAVGRAVAPPVAPSAIGAGAPAPAAASGAPQTVGALAPADESLRKDAGTPTPAPAARKAEAPVPPPPPAPSVQANESDRKEQTLADAEKRAPLQQEKQQQQQEQKQQQSQAAGQQGQAAAPQPAAVAQQSQAAPPPPPQTFIPPATQAVVVTEPQRAGFGGAATPQSSTAPAQPPLAAAAKNKLALSRQRDNKAAPSVNALPAFTWSVENRVLRVTPARDGALRIEAPTLDPMVVANARRGVAVRFAIPPEATMVRVSFGPRNASVDALSRAANQPVGSGSSGSVLLPPGAPNGPVSIEIPLK